jgi:hypothetical protein
MRESLQVLPGVRFVTVATAPHHPAFADAADRAALLALLESVRAVYEARLHGYALTATRLALLVRPGEANDDDARLRRRWARLGGTSEPPPARLRARLGSLSGFMQTLLQRASRDWNRRHGARGHLWSGRYRAALIADDRALLAAQAWLQDPGEQPGLLAVGLTSGGERADPVRRDLPALAAPALRLAANGFVFPADEAPPACAPPPADSAAGHLERFLATVPADARAAYGNALNHGWALGRPESLRAALARLARTPGGGGRSRALRDLDDDWGLCGVWG